ncbi:MAG TPA: hypothetical protein VEB22_01815 [Phycisphaerales bacterium]|nr:hypothetical protein [Phycisphaerales bacterium]
MRTPMWMGLLSVAGIVWAAPASAQVDPAAKKALEESVEAIKTLGPCTFTIKMSTEGLGKLGFSSDMNVKLIRGSAKGTHSFQMVGEFISPGGKPDDTKVHAAYLEGKMGEWIDGSSKTLYIRPLKKWKDDPASKEVLSKVQTPSKAFEVLFMDPEPFKTELASTELTMEKSVNVNGEECQVVKANLAGGSAYRLVYISALDKLPRKYEQYMGKTGGPQQIRRFEVRDLNTDVKLTVADLRLKEPKDFKTDKVDLPPPPPPVAPSPPKEGRDNGKEETKQTETEKERQKEIDAEREKNKEKQKEKVPEEPFVPTTKTPGKG